MPRAIAGWCIAVLTAQWSTTGCIDVLAVPSPSRTPLLGGMLPRANPHPRSTSHQFRSCQRPLIRPSATRCHGDHLCLPCQKNGQGGLFTLVNIRSASPPAGQFSAGVTSLARAGAHRTQAVHPVRISVIVDGQAALRRTLRGGAQALGLNVAQSSTISLKPPPGWATMAPVLH